MAMAQIGGGGGGEVSKKLISIRVNPFLDNLSDA